MDEGSEPPSPVSGRVAQALESSIGDLPGVRRVKADIGPEGVESLRVLVIPERSTTKTVAEVKDILSHTAEHSVVDTRIQVIRTAPTKGSSRRKLSMLSLDRSADNFSVRAALEISGDVLMGEARSHQGRLFERKAIADAILKGTHELVGFPLEVERVYVISEIENSIAVVVLARGDEILVGSAVVRLDEYDAIARATLDALNRFTQPAYDEDAPPVEAQA